MLVVLSASCADPASTGRTAASSVAAQAAQAATAKPVPPDPRVGAVFLGGQSLHTCSGAVLDSAAGDLILTAAHCMADGIDAYFVPGFAGTAAGQDFFHVDAVYLDPRWVTDQDPVADFAVARVTRDTGGPVEARPGAGFGLGSAPTSGTEISVTGYPLGEGGEPVGCVARTTDTDHGFPSLPCAGLVDGTSGSPWVAGAVIAGLTGGLEGGGCEENLSYSAPFDGAVERLLARAEAGGPADAAPMVFDDDC